MLKALEWITALAVVALIVSSVGIAYLSSPPAGKQQEQQATTQSENEKQTEKQHSLRGFIRFLFPDGIAVFTFFLFLATIALGVVAVVQIGYLTRAERIAAQSADAAKKSAEVAYDTLVATNRPWVSVDLAIAGPLTYNETEARIEIAFILKNTGVSPAINVQVDAEIAFPTDSGKSPLDVMKEICKRAKESPDDKDPVLGHTIFKDRDFTYLINLGILKERIRNAFNNFDGADKGANEWLFPSILGCVSYRFPFERGRHVTEFIADLRKRNPANPKAPFSFKMSDGDVAVNEMVLTRSFIGGNAD